jgi:hypothetical protein
VSKDGDRILFQIQNGGREHFVSRSTDPGRFDPGSRVPVSSGAYTDRLDCEEPLVYYRIE